MTLRGKIALVTGASRGIGRAIALAYAAEGADIAVAARSLADLNQVASEIETYSVRALAVHCDVTDAASVADLPAAIEAELGPIDVLVNNAGIAGSHKFVGHPDELWQRMLEVNLTGTYRVCKAFVPGMIERGRGRIINIASIAAKIGGAYIAAYTASKHGVLGLTRALAAELAEHNINVNAICPGYVDTPMTSQGIKRISQKTGRSESEARTILERSSPQKRLMQPEEVAAVAVLLASESGLGINGQAINVDGGAVMY